MDLFFLGPTTQTIDLKGLCYTEKSCVFHGVPLFETLSRCCTGMPLRAALVRCDQGRFVAPFGPRLAGGSG